MTTQPHAPSPSASFAPLVERARAQALEAVFDSVLVTDGDGRIVDWNQGSARIYGYSRDEVLGEPVAILQFPENSQDLLQDILCEVRRSGRWQGVTSIRRKDGREGWVEASVVAVLDEEGQQVGALGISRDISPRIELEQARSKLFADISHEFRTPLTLAMGPLDDLLDGLYGPLPEAMRKQVELARRNAGRVLDLTQQILELAQLEAGATRPDLHPLDLRELTAEVTALLQPLARRRTIRLDVRLPDPPVLLEGDSEQLRRVLSNLVTNALTFTPEGGAVRIALQAEEDQVRIEVRDSGPGIPASELEHVFDRFQRLEGHGSRAAGAGLGLALARELVVLHGGTIAVDSDEGFGSTFTVVLPRTASTVAASPADADEEQPEPESDDDRPTVLIVEDNADIRAYLRKHFARSYDVLEAADGAEGLDLARALLPDLVLADVMMPGIDGFELCNTLKADPDTDFIPVVLLTARAAEGDRIAGLRERADDYVTKPFDVRELLARVDNLIATRKHLRERFAGPGLVLTAETVDASSTEARFLESVRRAIEDNLDDEEYSVERLASDVAHSRGHLHRRLRDLIDEAPSDLLRRMRLERAAQLIDADAGTIGTIAYAVGFKSISHFSNRFQEHFGVRPSAYASRDER